MKPADTVRRFTEVLRRKHLALATEKGHCAWLGRACDYLKGLPSHLPSEQKLKRFLTDLATKDVAAGTQNQAFNAIVFLHQQILGAQPRPKLGRVCASSPAQGATENSPPVSTVGTPSIIISSAPAGAGGRCHDYWAISGYCAMRVGWPFFFRPSRLIFDGDFTPTDKSGGLLSVVPAGLWWMAECNSPISHRRAMPRNELT
jgi:hypothetical protein